MIAVATTCSKRNLKPNRICICGTAFYAAPSHVAKGWGRYCSVDCAAEARSGDGNGRWQGSAGDCICLNCGKQFRLRPSHIAQGEGKYCSLECRRVAFGTQIILCEQCDQPIVHYASQPKRRFCSARCRHLARPRDKEQKRIAREELRAQRDFCVCRQCGKSFLRARRSARHKGYYCSRDCSVLSRRKRTKCATCGTEFFASNARGHKYCSKACSATKGSASPAWRGGQGTKLCKICQTPFLAYSKSPKVYCSPNCKQTGQSARSRGEANPNWRGGKVTVSCAVCGNVILLAKSQILNRTATYCCRECFKKGEFGDRTAKRWGSKWGLTGVKSGRREDLGIYVRSSWEANYARYLIWLKGRGEITEWEYEPETFEFTRIRRGTRFYTPDFRVTLRKRIEYHEVKGWMHPHGKTALDRMARYYPEIKIVLIQKAEYNELIKKVSGLIPNWE